jgi:uncharacterized protein YeeX (DUF496 family)
MPDITLEFIAARLDQIQTTLALMQSDIERLKDDNIVTAAILTRLENNVMRQAADTGRTLAIVNRISDRVLKLETSE